MGSAPLAIASVTAVLRDVLANGLIRYSTVTGVGDVNVTVMSPDRIAVGGDEANQLNLFMYRVAPHAALARRPQGAPASTPRIALNLNYLLTAYGSQDFHGEILLGCAVHLLSGIPAITPALAADMLQPAARKGQRTGMAPARAALAASTVLQASPELRLTQQFMSFEDMSKLWSMLQARYRPSVAYEVSAVSMPFAETPA